MYTLLCIIGNKSILIDTHYDFWSCSLNPDPQPRALLERLVFYFTQALFTPARNVPSIYSLFLMHYMVLAFQNGTYPS
jgi:hypothetical protein